MSFYSTPSTREIDHAADVLGVTLQERYAMHGYYRRQREQDRAANIALLKGLWCLFLGTLLVLAKVALVLGLLYLFMVGILAASEPNLKVSRIDAQRVAIQCLNGADPTGRKDGEILIISCGQ